MGSNEHELERFSERNNSVYKATMRTARSRGQADAISNLAAFLLFFVMLALGAEGIRYNAIEPADLITF